MGNEQSSWTLSAENEGGESLENGDKRGKKREKTSSKHHQKEKFKEDMFMTRVDVVDHIEPIRAALGKSGVLDESEEGGGGRDADLNAFLTELRRKSEEDEGDDSRWPAALEKALSTSSELSLFKDEKVGILRHLVSKDEFLKRTLSDGRAHPVVIEGDLVAGSSVRLVDVSEFKEFYPVMSVEWKIGTKVDDSELFMCEVAHEGSEYLLPISSIGRYIKAMATRRIQYHLKNSKISQPVNESGPFDAHTGQVYQSAYKPVSEYQSVLSSSIAGPVLIPDSWARSILNALAGSSYSCFFKLWQTQESNPGLWDSNLWKFEDSSLRGGKTGDSLGGKDSMLKEEVLVGSLQVNFSEYLVEIYGAAGEVGGGEDLWGFMKNKRKSTHREFLSTEKPVKKTAGVAAWCVLPLHATKLFWIAGGVSIARILLEDSDSRNRKGTSKASPVAFPHLELLIDPPEACEYARFAILSFEAARKEGKGDSTFWKEFKGKGSLSETKLLIHRGISDQNILENLEK